MIKGAHILMFSSDAEKDRKFFQEVLGWRHVDAGHGWLIFASPPAEFAVHPGEEKESEVRAEPAMLGAEVYLMCDDLDATMQWLAKKKVQCGKVSQERWGRKTTIRLPSGGALGLYQPTHPVAIKM